MRLLGLGRRQRGALEFMKDRLYSGFQTWESDISPRVLASLKKRGLVTVETYLWSNDGPKVVKLTAEGRKMAEHWFCKNTGGR